MIPRDPSPHRYRVAGTFFTAGLLWIVALAGVPSPAHAGLIRVQALPASPTTCDAVTLAASGMLSSPCYEIVGATVAGPEPPNPLCMAPVCPARFEIRIVVREPAPGTACVTMFQPYSRSFPVGQLPLGAYQVRATEIVVPNSPDSVAFPKDSSSVSLLFFVTKADTCPPQLGCVMLGFARPSRPADIVLWPSPSSPDSISFCTAAAPPGGTGCFELTLHNDVPVGGLQTEIAIYDPLVDPPPGGPTPSGAFTPVSAAAAGRAGGLQAQWSAAGGVLKVLLYSTSGATIPPGDGSVLHLCYKVAPGTRRGHYVIRHQGDVVADSEGTALPACPTLVETTGEFCVVTPGCDLDGDGRADIRDIVRLVHCALETPGGPTCPDSIAARADCNADGVIDVRDVICCVRKILSLRAAAGNYAVLVPPLSGEKATFGFDGAARWISPVEGRATLLLHPGVGFGGADFSLRTDPSRIRIYDLKLLGPDGYHLEWVAGRDNGAAYAMLYAEGTADAARPVTIEVTFDRIGGAPGAADLVVSGFTPAAATGALMASGAAVWRLSVPSEGVSAPTVFPARPNPFAMETEIAYALPAAARVTLRVYDVTGRLVRTLVDGAFPAGVHHLSWNGKDDAGRSVRSGIYFLRLDAAGVTRTGRLLRLR